jgi:predicted dehydrogenase
VIRAGVIGAGDSGCEHARAYAALPAACVLAGVHDADAGRAAAAAERFGTRAFGALEEMLREVDVVSVASPAELRFHHTALALEHGLDVLIEQPVAPTPENARMLDRIASLRPRRPVVQVSAPDRFDSTLGELERLASGLAPVAIEIRRVAPAGEAVEDAMAHDVDTLVRLAGSPLVRLQASGRRARSDGPADLVAATLVFESGLVGTLTAIRGGPAPVREITVTAAGARIVADTLGGALELTRAADPGSSPPARELLQPAPGDPVLAQAEAFLAAVASRSAPEPGLSAAIACLEVADRVRECIAVQVAATGTGAVLAR